MESLYKVMWCHGGNICTDYTVAKSKQAVRKEYVQLGNILSIADIYYINEILRKHCNSYIKCSKEDYSD